jgi:hypothetical protein
MDILINEKLYDIAFTIVLKFWKESEIKKYFTFSCFVSFFICSAVLRDCCLSCSLLCLQFGLTVSIVSIVPL